MARNKKRGHAALEVALIAPWVFFLFAGAFDFGFYAHGMISAQNAARVAAEYTATSSSTAGDAAGACQFVRDEMAQMRNVRSLSNCNSLPLIVTAVPVTGADGTPATAVSVTYQSDVMIPIPGLMRQMNVTRRVQMMLKNL